MMSTAFCYHYKDMRRENENSKNFEIDIDEFFCKEANKVTCWIKFDLITN